MKTIRFIEFCTFNIYAGIIKMPIDKYNSKLKAMMKRHGHPLSNQKK